MRPPRHPDHASAAPADPGGPRRRPSLQLLAVTALVIGAGAVGVLVHSVLSSDRHAAAHHDRPAAAPGGRTAAPRTAHTARTGGPTAHVHAGPIRPLSGAGMPAGPVPAHFTPQSFTAVSAARWWLLGSAPCASPPCTSILRTDDGGRHFVGIPAPRSDAVSQLRFADARDGFAFDPALWTTHDDGAAWHAVPLPGTVAELATSGGYAYAIVQTPAGHGTLMRAPVGTDSWGRLASAGAVRGGLWAQGRDVVVESAGGRTRGPQMLVSTDSGKTFSRHAVPPSVGCEFALTVPAALWAHCATGTLSGIWRAAGPPGATPLARIPGHGLPVLPNSAAFAAATATTAVTGAQQLYRTTDGGVTWQRIRTPSRVSAWRYLGITDPLRGVALGAVGSSGAGRLWHTSNAGASYQPVNVG